MSTIKVTPERLRALVRAAYEDGFEDGVGAHSSLGQVHLQEEDWGQSVTKSNLDQDLAKAALKGGKFE